MKYGHVPLFFELKLQCIWFLQTCRHFKDSMHVNTMYRDCVSAFVWCTLSSAAKTTYFLPLEQQWHVTIFRHFMAKLLSLLRNADFAFSHWKPYSNVFKCSFA